MLKQTKRRKEAPRTRVAQVVSEKLPVPPVSGGAVQALVYSIAREAEKRVDVTVFSRPADVQKDDPLYYEPVGYSALDRFFDRILSIEEHGIGKIIHMACKVGIVLSYVLRVALRLKNEYDIIHIHNDPNFVNMIGLSNPKSRIFLHMHNRHFTSQRYAGILRPSYKLAIDRTEKILCISEFIRNDILCRYQNARGKCLVVNNGVDPELFQPRSAGKKAKIRERYALSPSQLTLLFAGRLEYKKGLHLLLEALAHISAGPFQLLVAGTPKFNHQSLVTSYEKEIFKAAETFGNQVRFLGFIRPGDMADLYAVTDIAVVPSLHEEGGPLVVLEAMASKCCVIGTNRGAIPEKIIHNQNGLLFDPSDTNALAGLLTRTMTDENLRRILGENARKTIQEGPFTLEKMTAACRSLYE